MASQAVTPTSSESRILIIMTGGTICMRPSAKGLVPARGFLHACLAPQPTFNDQSDPPSLDVMTADNTKEVLKSLRLPVSAYGKKVLYTVMEFEVLLDSSSIDAKGWAQIAEAIYRNYRRFDGFVVLHGTDSMAYTSSALSFSLQALGKPVILTGSQSPMMELQNDANDNLLGALIIAGHFMIPEVCLFFNQKLMRGNRSTKISASSFDAFASPNLPPLATISSVKVDVSWPLVYRSTKIDSFSISTRLETSVAALRIFPGIMPEMVEGVLALKGLKGLILETFGAGNAPDGPDDQMIKALGSAIARGVVIVNITQCLNGSVRQAYAPGAKLNDIGVISGLDQTCEAALTKLCYLLGSGLATEEVTRLMSTSLRGELTESSEIYFEHPGSQNLGREQTKQSALGYAIVGGDLEDVKHELKGQPDHILETGDYLGNTAVHLASCGPNASILEFILSRGASVHIRNRAGKTALFLAASAGLIENVRLLRKAGAHLHSSEIVQARFEANGKEDLWKTAGLNLGGALTPY